MTVLICLTLAPAAVAAVGVPALCVTDRPEVADVVGILCLIADGVGWV